MRPLDPPTIDLTIVFDTCIESITPPRKHRLLGAKNTLVDFDALYDDLAQTADLNLFEPHEYVGGSKATKKDMTYVYSAKLVGGAGRHFYDLIRASAPNATCPYCGQRKVTTLDHFLPKSEFPSFAISPRNLVPCCSDCNKSKGSSYAEQADDQFIHPYYDKTDHHPWLVADVVESAPIAVTFRVVHHSEMDDATFIRIKNQFNELQLGQLYASHAAEELSNLRHVLSVLMKLSGSTAVYTYLSETAESYADNQPNSWNTAFYTALAQSRWFREEGCAML